MKIVAIVGSPRPQGNSSYLTDVALEEVRKNGIDVEKVVLVEKQIGWCLAHSECGTQPSCLHSEDDGAAIVEKLYDADGILLASPVQIGNVSGIMKNFMDRTRFKGHDLKMTARSVGLITTATNAGIDDTLAILGRFLARRTNVPPEKIHKLGGKAKRVGDAKANTELTQKARELGQKMAQDLKEKAS